MTACATLEIDRGCVIEFSLGHFTQRAAPDAFRRANKRLEFVGWWGIILGFVIITYYPTILAYCFSYMGDSITSIITGRQLPWAGEGLEGVQNASNYFFKDYLTGGTYIGPFRSEILCMLILAWVLMYFCIFRGVKLVGKIVWLTVPLPWIMLVILAVRGLTLDGCMKGLAFYLDPDWTQLAKPTTWRFAFGQVFFSQIRAITQPWAISNNFPKSNSSAPSKAAITISLPEDKPPSVLSTT